MATVSRPGGTSAAVKKARLEAERSRMSARIGLEYGCEDTKINEGTKKKNRFYFIFKLNIIGDTVSVISHQVASFLANICRVLARPACWTNILGQICQTRVSTLLLQTSIAR